MATAAIGQRSQEKILKEVTGALTFLAPDTLTNVEPNDTLVLYQSSGWGYILGHNNFGDLGWAEKYRINGQATVLGGVYYLFANTINTPSATATGRVYSVDTDGLPGTQLGSANIPFSTIPTAGSNFTYFTFSSPVAVADSFFMAFVLPPYPPTQDTIGVISTRDGNRESGTFGQNAALWNNSLWHDEFSDNWGLRVTYVLMPVIDFPTSAGAVSKNGLTINASYPNPANTEVVIPFEVLNPGAATIEVFTMAGVKVASFGIAAGKGHNQHTIATSAFAPGTYFYSVASGSDKIYSKFEVIR